ncbi:VOC family protein [Arachidicoccus soli]|uniref:VOC family protein n=1 Tax=Arachidicoccus soli TaxID=2341117 RepID=A0A386HKT8_9BACT|nr:VOC family protein [Arachidicoccus soli]AYD46508.1 VOC family protein [Arachidicoccus soli]
MKSINPYLNFPGNTEEAFNFYKSVFGGEFYMVMRMKDTPQQKQIPIELENKIMHISLPISTGQILMGTDALEEFGQNFSKGNNFSICIASSSENEGKELFDKLSIDGQIQILFSTQFWGDMFGQFVDKFGVQWMISYHEEN